MQFGVGMITLLLTCGAADGGIISRWLEQPGLSPGEFPKQTQTFIQRQIPPLELPVTAEEWQKQGESLRRRILDEIVFRGVPTAWYEGKPEVVWGKSIETGQEYHIRKLRYEALPGLWIPALLYEPLEVDGRIPAVLNVNGHVGPPGKTEGYEQIRCINLAKRGMLALHPEWLFFGELAGEDYRHNRLAYLDLCGVSGLSVFFLAMQRGIDMLEDYPCADPERIGMTGLSGGGWQTILLSSLDTRIAASAPNAGYIGIDYRTQFREDIGDLEQNPADLLTLVDYPHLTAMLAPRPTLLIYNEQDDCCFKSYRAYPSVYEPVRPFFALFDREEAFHYHENSDPGTHNYERDNREHFYRFINRCFLPQSDWVDEEIPSNDEVHSYEDLIVGLPDANADFFSLARHFLSGLPRKQAPEDGTAAFARWQEQGVQRLRDVLKIPSMTAVLSATETASEGAWTATWYRLEMTDGWIVPAVAIARSEGKPHSITIVLADGGKRSLAEEVEGLLRRVDMVIALDPLYMGESVSPNCPVSQCAMMVGAVGQRPLGIQVAQVSASIQAICQQFDLPKLSLRSIGWNAGVVALAGCALNREQVAGVSLSDTLSSLKQLIEEHRDYENCPPLFCFGLLAQFDMPELVRLCIPVVIKDMPR